MGLVRGLLLAGSLLLGPGAGQAAEFIPLGILPGGGTSSEAHGVSADGSVVVGWSDSSTGAQAFIWDPSHGMRSLLNVLIGDYGLGSQLTGWSLRAATAISPDGRHIVGWGVGPNGTIQAWLVRNLNPIPLPGGGVSV